MVYISNEILCKLHCKHKLSKTFKYYKITVNHRFFLFRSSKIKLYKKYVMFLSLEIYLECSKVEKFKALNYFIDSCQSKMQIILQNS